MSHCVLGSSITSTSVAFHGNVVQTICASVLPSVAIVLILVGLLVYCQLKRMERRKKDPPKMLPKADDIDASMRATSATIPEGQVNLMLRTYVLNKAR